MAKLFIISSALVSETASILLIPDDIELSDENLKLPILVQIIPKDAE